MRKVKVMKTIQELVGLQSLWGLEFCKGRYSLCSKRDRTHVILLP